MSMFPHTCTIIKTAESLDKRRGKEWSLSVSALSVPCFVQPSTADQQIRAEQVGYEVSHNVYFETSPAIGPLKNFIYWIDEASVAHLLEYQAHKDATVGLGFAWKMEAQELSTWPPVLPV